MASAQLPVIQLYQNPASGWNGTPEGLGNMALHWLPTNQVASPPAVISNWVDNIQGAKLSWNNAGNQPVCTTTGILFKATTGARDALTNNYSLAPALGTGNGTNISMFIVFNQINNNFGSGNMTMIGGFNGGSVPCIENSGAGTDLNFNTWNGNSLVPTVSTANTKSIDLFLSVSNGLMWVWTNGIVRSTALSWNVAAGPWTGLQVGCEPAKNPWHGTVTEIGVYTNLPFNGTSVSNLHYYITNVAFIKGISP